MTELLRKGARQLIQQAVEAELAELLERYAGRVDERGRRAVVRNGHLPEREILTGVGPVPVKVPKVRSRAGGAGLVSLLLGAAVREESSSRGSGPALAVPEGYRHGTDAGGAGGVGRPGGERAVVFGYQSPEAGKGGGVCRMVPPGRGSRPLGLSVGGRHLQRPESGPPEALCTGDHRRERAGREALSGHRGWGSGVDPELAGSAAMLEAAWAQGVAKAGGGRWGSRVLVGAG